MNGKDSALLERITTNPQVMVGKPVIRGTRITVDQVLRMLSQGMTFEEILEQYRHITSDDILACLSYGERVMTRNQFLPTRMGM